MRMDPDKQQAQRADQALALLKKEPNATSRSARG